MEETFSVRNFHGFWQFLRKFIPHNILKDVIHTSVFLRNISLYVDRKSLLNLSTQEFFFTWNLKMKNS